MCCGRAGTLDENIKYGYVEDDSKNRNGSSTYNVNRCSLEVSDTYNIISRCVLIYILALVLSKCFIHLHGSEQHNCFSLLQNFSPWR